MDEASNNDTPVDVPVEAADPDPGDTPEPPAGEPEPEPADDADPGDGHEAARWRKRLRAAEAERDELATKVEALQRAKITEVAGQWMRDGADWWRHSDVPVGDFANADGSVDVGKLEDALRELRKTKEYLFKERMPGAWGSANGAPRPDPSQGPHLGRGGPSWSEVLRKA